MLEFLKGALNPLFAFIDSLHTSGEEKNEAKLKVLQLQADLEREALAFDKALAEARSRVIEAEAKSEHALTAMWRPIAMLTFLGIIVYQGIVVSIFNAPPVSFTTIPAEMWDLLKIGIGGYVVGRSVEKAVKEYANGRK